MSIARFLQETALGLGLLTAAAGQSGPMVRVAEIEVDPARLDEYRTLLREEIEASIRLEPGVLTLYAVAVQGQPSQIRIFETYADEKAYRAHLETAHFRKYKARTQAMVKSLKLMEMEPIALGTKGR